MLSNMAATFSSTEQLFSSHIFFPLDSNLSGLFPFNLNQVLLTKAQIFKVSVILGRVSLFNIQSWILKVLLYLTLDYLRKQADNEGQFLRVMKLAAQTKFKEEAFSRVWRLSSRVQDSDYSLLWNYIFIYTISNGVRIYTHFYFTFLLWPIKCHFIFFIIYFFYWCIISQ